MSPSGIRVEYKKAKPWVMDLRWKKRGRIMLSDEEEEKEKRRRGVEENKKIMKREKC